MPVDVKICGLGSPDAVAAAVEGGASYLGFVFFDASPRALTPATAAPLMAEIPDGIIRVGVVVDPSDEAIAGIVAGIRLDMLQLHGQESPQRSAEIRQRSGLGVIKAIAVSSEQDIDYARSFEDIADILMFDAKPPKGAERPGGHALAFDWQLIQGRLWNRPWILAGGLNAANIGEAVRISGAATVDVSSGVEDSPGVKNPDMVRKFIRLAKEL